MVLDRQAVGRVVSYDQVTGVLKYWQDRTNSGFSSDGNLDATPIYGFRSNKFTSNPSGGGNLTINGGSVVLGIQTVHSRVSQQF